MSAAPARRTAAPLRHRQARGERPPKWPPPSGAAAGAHPPSRGATWNSSRCDNDVGQPQRRVPKLGPCALRACCGMILRIWAPPRHQVSKVRQENRLRRREQRRSVDDVSRERPDVRGARRSAGDGRVAERVRQTDRRSSVGPRSSALVWTTTVSWLVTGWCSTATSGTPIDVATVSTDTGPTCVIARPYVYFAPMRPASSRSTSSSGPRTSLLTLLGAETYDGGR